MYKFLKKFWGWGVTSPGFKEAPPPKLDNTFLNTIVASELSN